jgi:hypothetical protein
MAQGATGPDSILVVISIGVAALSAMSVQHLTDRYGAALLFLIALFFLLYASAAMRRWTAPFVVPVVRSPLLSELFLGLALMVTALAVSWYIGLAVSRAFSDGEGILAGLLIFGAVMLAISTTRNWQ